MSEGEICSAQSVASDFSQRRSVAVVILNYGQIRYTVACLESLLRLSTPATWIIVVDNGSADDSVARLQEWIGRRGVEARILEAESPQAVNVATRALSEQDRRGGLWLILSPRNKGYAGGNNLGIALSCRLGADAVWLLNNDTEVAPDALRAMRDELFSRRRPGLCGSLILYHDDPRFVQCRGGGKTNKWTGLSILDGYRLPLQRALEVSPATVAERLDFIYGASVMVSRKFVETVGLMDEGYFMYCEEQDWAYSAAGRFDFAYAADAVVYHHEGASTGWPTRVKPGRLLQMVRSRIRLTAKHVPYALPTVCCAIAFAAVRLVFRRILLKFGIGQRKLDKEGSEGSTRSNGLGSARYRKNS